VVAARGPGRRPLRLSLYPARFGRLLAAEGTIAYYILIDDPEQVPRADADRVAHQYALTPSEAKLLARLVAGDALKDAAAALAISVNTARFQLKQIMHKTDTHRQVDLLRLCLGLERAAPNSA
jgi:DNA-binding CsgD family transcriptional regulator